MKEINAYIRGPRTSVPVEWYGSIVTGSSPTDAQAIANFNTLQAAFTDIPDDGGRTLALPEAVIAIDPTRSLQLSQKRGFKIEGRGRRSRILHKSASGIPLIQVTPYDDGNAISEMCELRNFYLYAYSFQVFD